MREERVGREERREEKAGGRKGGEPGRGKKG